jgi:hypothetical protein
LGPSKRWLGGCGDGQGQGRSPSRMVLPAEYRRELLQRLAATGQPLGEAARELFRGRDFYGRLEGRPEDLQLIRETLASDAFFG